MLNLVQIIIFSTNVIVKWFRRVREHILLKRSNQSIVALALLGNRALLVHLP